jgi:hypothetical protein
MWRARRYIRGPVRFFAPIFAALNQSGTRYVVVGGVATVLHGYVRGTTDVDVVLELTPVAARRALAALEAIGYRPQVPVQAAEFADPVTREGWIRDKGMVVFSMVSDSNPVIVDLFTRAPMDFDALWSHSELRAVEGGPVHIASLDDLIRLKQAAGRPQDLADVAELEQIRDTPRSGNAP